MDLTMQMLLEAGAHFGHQSKRWSPKMKGSIYSERNGVHIIDLAKTMEMMEKAAEFIENEVASGKQIIFVGTKRQARDIIVREATRCGAMYISNRWPGGLISNFKSVKNTIETYRKMLEMKEKNETAKLSKKDLSVFNKNLERKEKLVGGIKDLLKQPELLFVLDVKKEANAIKESRLVDLPVVAICDTNSNPDLVTLAIPGNDDASRSIELFVTYIADAVLRGRKRQKTTVKPVVVAQKPTVVTSAPAMKKVETAKEVVKQEEKKEEVKAPVVKKVTGKKLDELELPDVIVKKLQESGIDSIEELAKKKDNELLEIKGLGQRGLSSIKRKVSAYNKKSK